MVPGGASRPGLSMSPRVVWAPAVTFNPYPTGKKSLDEHETAGEEAVSFLWLSKAEIRRTNALRPGCSPTPNDLTEIFSLE